MVKPIVEVRFPLLESCLVNKSPVLLVCMIFGEEAAACSSSEYIYCELGHSRNIFFSCYKARALNQKENLGKFRTALMEIFM